MVATVGQNTAVVLFKDYGNHEEVLLSDLRKAGGGGTGRGQSAAGTAHGAFIPATPGLPPAFKQQS